MLSAEEIIIEHVGEYWLLCGRHKSEFLAAMEEYKTQSPAQDYKDWTKLLYEELKNLYDRTDESFLPLTVDKRICDLLYDYQTKDVQ